MTIEPTDCSSAISVGPYADARWRPLEIGNGLADLIADRLRFAEFASAWYRKKKRRKRTAALYARGAAITFGVVGGCIPLIAPLSDSVDARAGFLVLALSGGCALFDKLFRWSRDWGRYMIAATRIEAETELYRVRCVKVLEEGAQGNHELVTLSVSFTSIINAIIDSETSDWEKGNMLALSESERIRIGQN